MSVVALTLLAYLAIILSSLALHTSYRTTYNRALAMTQSTPGSTVSLKVGRNNKLSLDGFEIAYDLLRSSEGSVDPAVVFLPGLIRQKNEAKSINLQALCKKLGITFLCADYVGVGRSSGAFSDGIKQLFYLSNHLTISQVVLASGPKTRYLCWTL